MRILKRVRATSADSHEGDHASMFIAAANNDPPVDVVAEAKMIMKRARLETKRAKAKTTDARELSVGSSEANLNEIEVAGQASNTDGRVEGAGTVLEPRVSKT